MVRTKLIRVLANAQVLVRLLAEEGTMSIAEIAEATNIPRATIYRLADGLADVGLAEVSKDSSVQLSRRWFHLSYRARRSLKEWSSSAQVLTDLQTQTQQTVYLCVPRLDWGQSTAALCIDWRPGSALNVMVLKPGRTLPLHAGASGKAMLAFGDTDPARYAEDQLDCFTSKTLTTSTELTAEAKTTQSRGYSISDEDVTLGIGALGAPIFDVNSHLIGALSIAGHAEEFRNCREVFSEAVMEAARILSG